MASQDRLPVVTLRNAEILPGAWRNFGGEERFNEQGKRVFNIKLPVEVAEQMLADGFNVKELKPREEDEAAGIHPGYRIEIAVSYKFRPPQVWLVSGGHRTLLDEGAINILDYADIAKASIAINPSPWDVNGKQGIKAYLHKAVIYLVEDELDDEMRDIPVSGGQSNVEMPDLD